MKQKHFLLLIALVILVPVAITSYISIAKETQNKLTRPEGPCDVYAKGGAPCVAAHSSTRALYSDYNGPLYQVQRQSDGKTMDIGVVPATSTDRGGYADAAAQDAFCADTYCWITILYDQSGKENHLVQAPRGGFSGQAMGGFNNVPLADMAPITIMGHKAYGIFITAGIGLRWNDAKGTAVDDQAEGQYWVISGHHYNTGCCFDYGNAETDSRDDGDGTMETTYFGNQPAWYRGSGPGPWIMTDQENNLVGCVNPDPNDKYCANLPSISWRFVTATADGEPHHWRSMGGDAQTGELIVMYDGQRIQNERNSYDPMRKQGAILLGNGGDNSNGSSGTFYEAAMTAPGTFPSLETNQAIQANVVAAKYDVQRLAVTAADKTDAPNGLQTFAPGTTANTSVIFVNTTGSPISDLTLSIDSPKGWKTSVLGTKGESVKKVGYTVAPGQTVVATFSVSSNSKEFNGDMVAKAIWTGVDGLSQTETAIQKVRNVPSVKINEFRITDGSNSTNSFIELYNAGNNAVDISGWSLTQHAVNLPYFSSINIPAGTTLPGKSYYLMGLATSGLSVDAAKGDNSIYVRSVAGINVGDEIEIGTGSKAEKRKVTKVVAPKVATSQDNAPFGGRGPAAPGTPTTIWQPLPEGPVITIPAGSTNIPVTSIDNIKVGDKLAIGYGAQYPAVSNNIEKYEVVTVTSVGKPGTQAWLSMDAKKGDRNIKVSSTENISVGDKIRLDIASEGHGVEWVTVKAVGTPSVRSTFNGPLKDDEDPGTGLTIKERLKYNHSSNMPFSVNGTGITFTPASKYDHSSNEPVLALVYALELDSPLASNHGIDDVVFSAKATEAGYQGCVAADMLFGGPALSTSKGNMTLRNNDGLIVDAMNYGGLVDPWLGEGYHGEAGAGKEGSYAPVPMVTYGWGSFANPNDHRPNMSVGRYPDGSDTDDNQRDFNKQKSFNFAAAAKAGEKTINVSSVANLSIGQHVVIGYGKEMENAVIATIGTAGATTVAVDAQRGATQVLVASSSNFVAGQEVMVNGESVVIDKISASRRFRRPNPNSAPVYDTIFLKSPLKNSCKAGAQCAGTGVTLASPLKYAHNNGTSAVNYVPTPGMPNRY